jgi:hypothetical protein
MLKKYLKEKGDAKVYELGQKSKQIQQQIHAKKIPKRKRRHEGL